MRDLFEKIRDDKEFNLETLSYQEIFVGIKDGIANAIYEISKEKINAEDLVLNIDRCSTRYAYAENGNLYPKIYLDMNGFYSVLLNPFEIDLIESKYKIRTVSTVGLRECFYNFMCEKFPNCNYEKVFEKYLIDSQNLRKTRDTFLFM